MNDSFKSLTFLDENNPHPLEPERSISPSTFIEGKEFSLYNDANIDILIEDFKKFNDKLHEQFKNLKEALVNFKFKCDPPTPAYFSTYSEQIEWCKNNLNLSSPIYFIDSYDINNQEIKHYGLNVSKFSNNISASLDEMNLIVNKDIDEELGFDCDMTSNAASSRSSSHKQSSAGQSSSSNKFTKKSIKKLLLHPLELILIHKAIHNELDEIGKVVVVDILERKDGVISFQDTNNNIPETHSVLLNLSHKHNGKNVVAVIDPNNSSHSYIIKSYNFLVNDSDYNFIAQDPTDKGIKKIYTAQSGNTGPNIDAHRDCTDIALKMGSAILTDKSQKDYSRLETDISKLDPDSTDIAKQVYNTKVINDFQYSYSTAPIEDCPTRILHTSDYDLRNKIVTMFKKINKFKKDNYDHYPSFEEDVSIKYKFIESNYNHGTEEKIYLDMIDFLNGIDSNFGWDHE